MLGSLAGAGALSLLPSVEGIGAPVGRRRDEGRIRRENARPGTLDWMLARTQVDPATKYRCPWIEGYVSRASVRSGESLQLFVSTAPASSFRMDVYRLGYYGGLGGRQVGSYGPFKGRVQRDPAVGTKRVRNCLWEPSFEWVIPEDWVSGVYLGKLTAERGGWQSYVVWIVRDDREADFLFQCSDNTWQAYNRWPSQFALYDNGVKQWFWGPGVRVGFDRPYGKYCQILDAPLSQGSGEFLLWEFPVAYWMEAQGYDVTYISNLDTHADGEGLLRARGFLSVGHDEYWSQSMYENVRRARDRGVNLAFLSGNAVYGHVEYSENGRGREDRVFERIDIFGPPDAAEIKSFPEMKGFPFQSLSGGALMGARSVTPVTGGADWACDRPDHWLFEGTGMKKGDGIPGLVGWEWHGDPDPIPGLEVVSSGATQSNPGKLNGGRYTATVYPGPKGNFVFNASTIWWGDGLSAPPGYVRPSVYTSPRGPDRRVQRITRNLLERMRGPV